MYTIFTESEWILAYILFIYLFIRYCTQFCRVHNDTYVPSRTIFTESLYLLSRRRGKYDEVKYRRRGTYDEANMPISTRARWILDLFSKNLFWGEAEQLSLTFLAAEKLWRSWPFVSGVDGRWPGSGAACLHKYYKYSLSADSCSWNSLSWKWLRWKDFRT